MFFYHPDYTVGAGISLAQSCLLTGVADYNRRSGISPCPEENILIKR